ASIGRNLHTWWIDDLGRWNQLEAQSRNQRKIIESDFGGEMMYRFYGMVRMAERRQQLECRWDVKRAFPDALEGAAVYLRQAGLPVKLCFYFGAWQSEYFSDPEMAYQR